MCITYTHTRLSAISFFVLVYLFCISLHIYVESDVSRMEMKKKKRNSNNEERKRISSILIYAYFCCLHTFYSMWYAFNSQIFASLSFYPSRLLTSSYFFFLLFFLSLSSCNTVSLALRQWKKHVKFYLFVNWNYICICSQNRSHLNM